MVIIKGNSSKRLTFLENLKEIQTTYDCKVKGSILHKENYSTPLPSGTVCDFISLNYVITIWLVQLFIFM